MEKDLGKEVGFEIEVVDGDVVLKVAYDGKGADASVSVKLEGDYFLDKLADAIPGEIDDMIIGAIKGAMK